MSQGANEYKTPVYLVTGFLESGKTSLIKSMLEDENFSSGERTLIIMCEEGIEELDKQLLRKSNAVLEVIELRAHPHQQALRRLPALRCTRVSLELRRRREVSRLCRRRAAHPGR